jgi:hypothetical protein
LTGVGDDELSDLFEILSLTQDESDLRRLTGSERDACHHRRTGVERRANVAGKTDAP